MDDLISEFIAEAAEGLGSLDVELISLEQNPNDAAIIGGIFRIVHTIKGTCGFLGLPRLERVSHAAENVLGGFRDSGLIVSPEAVTLILRAIDQLKEILAALEDTGLEPEGDDADLIAALDALAADDLGAVRISAEVDANDMIDLGPPETDLVSTTAAPTLNAIAPKMPPTFASANGPETPPRELAAAAQSIRVNVNLLEDLMTMVSELVLTRNQLMQTMRGAEATAFTTPLQRLNHITSELHEGVMKTRMQPIGTAWNKLPRVVRDLAHDLGKTIDLKLVGAETELDRQVLELIKDPLTHMVRNSCDHGLESPEERRTAGKPDTGSITLHAAHEGGHIVIRISDDGRGLDVQGIRAKVLEKGLATEAELETLTPREILQFIFKPGFSTAAVITNVSGRGVGMDVVRTNIERIGGSIDLESETGAGTTVSIKIPLTLTIVSALILGAGGEKFAIPQISVLELVRTSAQSEHRIETIDQTPVLRLRDRLLPLIHLGRLLGLSETDDVIAPESFIVVAQVGHQVFGLVVDEVFDTEEIVVKPVAPLLRNIPVFSGNTILGDGTVIMILDPNGIAATLGAARTIERRSEREDRTNTRSANSEIVSLLIFKAGDGARKAAPLSLVARLEEMSSDAVESADGRLLMQYRDKLMPLLPIDPAFDLHARERRPIIVFNDGPRWAGLIVDEIIDIVETPLTAEIKGDTPGVVGSMIVDGQSTELVDTAYYLTRIHKDWFANISSDAPKNNAILVVDDSPFFRHLLSPLLQQAGYLVTSVANAEQALRLKDAGAHFDLIVSDVEMPGMDGFAFAEAVKASTEWANVPLVALSGKTSDERVERGRLSGFVDYIGKTDRDALLTALSENLETTGAQA